jgi:conflict system STAND superfamily ATPase
VSDTAGQPGGLPLLSTALLELWTRRRDRTLRLGDYLRAGGVQGAVARLAEEAFGRLDGDGQAAAKGSCCAWLHRAKPLRSSAAGLCFRSSTWTATPTRRARWRC